MLYSRVRSQMVSIIFRKKRWVFALLFAATLCCVQFLVANPAYAASSSQSSIHNASVIDTTTAVTVQVHRMSPGSTCFHCCPSGDLQYQYTFTWIGGLIHENIIGSFHFPGHCTGSVTLNWENCTRDTQNAAVTQCLNYSGVSGRRWVEADINVTIPPYLNHSTWGAFSVDPYATMTYQQGPNP